MGKFRHRATKNVGEKRILPKIVRTIASQDLWPETTMAPGEAAELLAGGVQRRCFNGEANRNGRFQDTKRRYLQVNPEAGLSLLLDLFESLNQLFS
jgi:hypothetical protein